MGLVEHSKQNMSLKLGFYWEVILVSDNQRAIEYFEKLMQKGIEQDEYFTKFYYYDLAIKALEESKSLVPQANSYMQIEKFFYKNKRIKPFFEEAQNECVETGNVGMATIIITTIENLLDELE